MTHAHVKARVAQDKRLRRHLLSLLYESRSGAHGGWLGGRFIADVMRYPPLPPGDQTGDDARILALMSDLADAGYADIRDDRERKTDPHGLDYLSYRVTARGVNLIEESIPPDPAIEDERIRRE